MPEEYPQEFHDAAGAAIQCARNLDLFAYLEGEAREAALEEHVTDQIGRILCPWMIRHIKAMTKETP